MRRLASSFLLLAALAFAQPVTVTVLATTDLHGNLLPIDYVTNRPAARGLASIATLVRGVRAGNPNTLLIDCGDTIQGSPLESVYQAGPHTLPDPMMAAMNLLGYDAMTLGNHEFNVGVKNFDRARSDARFPWISANTTGFPPYIVKTVGGIKVAVIGITTPVVPQWEKPENLGGRRFSPPVDAVQSALAALQQKERPNLVLVAAHSGLGPQEPAENVVDQIAERVPQLDAIVFGHTHSQLEGRLIGNVLLVQPKNWGASLARLDFTFDSGRLVSKKSALIPVTTQTAAAADLVALAKPYEEAVQRYLNTSVATCARELDGTRGRQEPTAIIEAIQRVQLHYASADVSFTAQFDPEARIPKGEVTVRQIAALYPYDNELFAIQGTGEMVKDALENAARYFTSGGGVYGFNFDMAAGVEYEIDRTRPEGSRIVNLRRNGKPLDPAALLRIAVNSYRAGGSAGYGMFKDAPILWRSGDDVRELMIRYYTERKVIPVTAPQNWRLLP